MALDPALEEALAQAVEAAGQPTAVVGRLMAWMRTMSEGDGTQETMALHYANVLEVLEVSEGDAD